MNNFIDLPPSLLRGIYEERDEIALYEGLLNLAVEEEDQKLISNILEDEKKHYNRFYCMYVKLTGNEPILPKGKEHTYGSFLSGIQRAFFNEVKACEFYRDIYTVQKTTEAQSAYFQVIADENRHAMLLNYLYCKHK